MIGDGNGDENGKRRGSRERGGQWRLEKKRYPLVGDMLQYRESYEGKGADYVPHLKHL